MRGHRQRTFGFAPAAVLAACLLAVGCAQNAPREAPPPREREPSKAALSADQRYRAEAHTQLGAEYYSRGRYDVAVEELNRALAADPGYAPAANVLGLVYMEVRDDVQATKNFELALRLAPNDPEVNNNFGWYLCNRGREKDAIRYFNAALADTLYRTPEKSLVNAGLCSRRMGDQAAAEGYFRRALAVAPSDPQVVYQLADLEFNRGAYPKAHNLLAMITPSMFGPEALWLGARVEYKLGDRDAVESYGLQLRKRFPDAKETALFATGRYE